MNCQCSLLEEQRGHQEHLEYWTAKYPNQGKRWTDEELVELAAMRAAGVPMKERENRFGRTSAAIANAVQNHLPRLVKEMNQ